MNGNAPGRIRPDIKKGVVVRVYGELEKRLSALRPNVTECASFSDHKNMTELPHYRFMERPTPHYVAEHPKGDPAYGEIVYERGDYVVRWDGEKHTTFRSGRIRFTDYDEPRH